MKPTDSPLDLQLLCTRCSGLHREEVQQVFVHPDRLNQPDWDGVVLSSLVVCPHCGAEDSYALTEEASLLIHRELQYFREIESTLPTRLNESNLPSLRVIEAEFRLQNRFTIRRQSQALQLLREATEQHPGDGRAWRGLGNFELQLGRKEQARQHLREACRVDETEIEAAFSLTDLGWEEGDTVTMLGGVETCLRRWHNASLESRVKYARWLVIALQTLVAETDEPLGLLATWLGPKVKGQQIVNLSPVNLRDVRRWEGLIEFLLDPTLIMIALTPELPDEPDTRLLARIEGHPFGDLPPPARTGPSPTKRRPLTNKERKKKRR